MKAARHLISCLFVFIAVSSSAQRKDSILLNQGWIHTTSNVSASSVESFNKQLSREKNKAVVVLQFESIPSQAVKNELAAAGIVLLDYLPHNAYTATISGNINA